jgi:alkanesulfonate monooxygenase SsuD/methylene tetrahydromethanopterin reductase-like flavin-dependent oxidoreductase (luciferase family)
MRLGIGLPSTVPGATGGEMRDWAMRAEGAGFSTLGTIDRLVYANHESLIALSYAAAVTERIGLLTSILLAPLRSNAALLAKQAASLDALSGGRLTLGLAVGGREDDYDVSGVDYHRRGAIFEQQLDDLRRYWDGEKVGFAGAIGPQSPRGRPEVVIGGRAAPNFPRAASWDGWMMGGGAPDTFPPEIEKLDAAWAAAGRDGEPRKMSLGYFALGDDARGQARTYITDYYGFLGEDAAQGFADNIPADADSIRAVTEAFAAAGCDELVWFPTSSDPRQVDLLADVVL